jgi:hypothetical protein
VANSRGLLQIFGKFLTRCMTLGFTIALHICRSTQRGGVIRLSATNAFEATISLSLRRMTALISSKLDQCFELSEYDWTPKSRETSPSMYLYELANWLTTVVDSLAIKETYKEDAYEGAMSYIAECLMVRFLPASFVTKPSQTFFSCIPLVCAELPNRTRCADDE